MADWYPEVVQVQIPLESTFFQLTLALSDYHEKISVTLFNLSQTEH